MQIGRKASLSIQQSGGQPELFINIIEMAIRVLETLPSVRQSDRQREAKEVLEKIPTKPKKSARAAEYPRLKEIYVKLQQQNRAILQKEQRIGNLETEFHECKSIFKGKRRKELQGEIE